MLRKLRARLGGTVVAGTEPVAADTQPTAPPDLSLELAHELARRPRQADPARDIAELMAFMRGEGWTGWLLSDDVVDAYRIWRVECGVEEIQEGLMLAMVASAPGNQRLRRRLLAVEDGWLKRMQYRDLLRMSPEQRADPDVTAERRPYLYRIASLEEMAEAEPIAEGAARPSPVRAGPAPQLKAARPVQLDLLLAA